jgi:hypothetical protein
LPPIAQQPGWLLASSSEFRIQRIERAVSTGVSAGAKNASFRRGMRARPAPRRGTLGASLASGHQLETAVNPGEEGMKRVALALCILALTLPASAQVQSGSIYGTIQDESGGVLPGAAITLVGPDRTASFASDSDGQYRFLNLAPGAYKLTVTLSGFSTVTRKDVVVVIGKNVQIPFTLKLATVEQSITVTSATPIIDTKQVGTATEFTQAELADIPTSRDPFALARTVPGVLVDRVNIAGNETGQQSNFVSKATRPQDAVWMLDGVNVTDMAAVGASPTYFNWDNFDEVEISTAGQDIRQPTGGMGINLVVKRGTNQIKGDARSYFTNHNLESSNVPAELSAIGVTPATADHNQQISDYGLEAGGPIVKDHAWFYGSYSDQDIRLVRRSGHLVDRTLLKDYDVKGNWQATKKDMVSVLWFLGSKVKNGRSPGDSGITFDAPTATFNQGNAYPASRPHGLLKIEDDRAMSSSFFLTAKYAYYGTGFTLAPIGGLAGQAGQSVRLAQSFGSTRQSLFLRPEQMLNVDTNVFADGLGLSHEFKIGTGYRRSDASSDTIWPGDMVVALDNSLVDERARIYREGNATNRVQYYTAYAGDTMSRDRLTVDAGVRYDRQWGSALPSSAVANAEFPNVVPGFSFAGYRAPFTWNNVSPRVGLTYTLDESRRTVVRASYTRYAGQLDTGTVGFANPGSSAGFADYRWVDLNGDHLVQPNEVLLNQFITNGNGFNPANPTSVVSANKIDPNLQAPVTTGVVVGIDREIMPTLALQLNYSYTRTSNLLGNFTFNYQPWVGLTTADYAAGPVLTGTLPDGSAYAVPTYIPNAALVTANGNSRMLTNYSGYHSAYHGVEASLVKRLANRWMARVAFSYNNPREYYDAAVPLNHNGNPTRTDTEPLVSGGQFAPESGGSGAGEIFIDAKWQMNANALYQMPWGIDVGANVFGRQGYPYVLFRSAALGRDPAANVLVTPQIDAFRHPNLWDGDVRASKRFVLQRLSLQIIGDLFNVANANTALVRVRNISAANFGLLAQNLSPRILRIGVKVGF